MQNETMQKPIGYGARIFENNKVGKRFGEIIKVLSEEQKQKFSNEILKLYEKKILSTNGEYTVFKITDEDLDEVLRPA